MIVVKRFLNAVVLFGVALLLTACQPPEPTMFGVPQSQWNQLTNSQKQLVIKGYNQRQQINAKNAPLNNAIGAAQNIVTNQQNLKQGWPPNF